MWSCGCILGELLGGKPLFPGSSTVNQLDRILEITGQPSAEDLESIDSPFAKQMIESVRVPKPKRIHEVGRPCCACCADAPVLTAGPAPPDLPERNGRGRGPAAQVPAIQPQEEDHGGPGAQAPLCRPGGWAGLPAPVGATRGGFFFRLALVKNLLACRLRFPPQFHTSGDEPACSRIITIPIDDNTKYSIAEYRDKLYGEIVRRKKELRKKLKDSESAREQLERAHINDGAGYYGTPHGRSCRGGTCTKDGRSQPRAYLPQGHGRGTPTAAAHRGVRHRGPARVPSRYQRKRRKRRAGSSREMLTRAVYKASMF